MTDLDTAVFEVSAAILERWADYCHGDAFCDCEQCLEDQAQLEACCADYMRRAPL